MRNPLQKLQESDLKVRVGRNVALLRTSKGKRQSEWAREYPHFISSPSKLSNWESGLAFPPALFLLELCELHGVTLDWFYTGRLTGVNDATAQQLRAAKLAD